MLADIINLTLAFIEGIALIISPCILPVLPLILAGSLSGSKRRPFGILLGFILSFALFTFFARQLVLWFSIDLELVRTISFTVLILLGFTMLSSYLSRKFASLTTGFAKIGDSLTQGNIRQDLIGGLVFGSLIGLIWTPCAGPILASVIVQSVLQQTTLASFLTILSFGFGVAIPMAAIIFFGRKILQKFDFVQNNTDLIRKIIGVVIILAVLGMMYLSPLLEANLEKSNPNSIAGNELLNGLVMPYPAPEFADIGDWLNSKPLRMEQLRGKVVLVDFWAYSCINCIRTLPYLKDWYKKYQDQGFIIVGVHSPEFDFERDPTNVQAAILKYGIKYPVGMDNNFATWKSYNNRYWPAHYLIDKRGKVVYEHFGEGEYATTENNIRYLLGLSADPKGQQETETLVSLQTPETYLGQARIDRFASPEAIASYKPQKYTYPAKLSKDAWALTGNWVIENEKIISQQANAAIKIKFNAKDVFAVMGSSGKPVRVKILLNGQIIAKKPLIVADHVLYDLIKLPQAISGELELISLDAGLQVYTFTFGS